MFLGGKVQKNILFNLLILMMGISVSTFYASNVRAEHRVLSNSEKQLALAYSNQVSYYYTCLLYTSDAADE